MQFTTLYSAAALVVTAFASSASAQSSSNASSSSAAASRPSTSAGATNFTYQVNWPARIAPLNATTYAAPKMVDLSKMPNMHWSLLNESSVVRQTVCAQQISFCDKAGCDVAQGGKPEDAKVHDNFCEPESMATKCTCSGGTSRLQQYQWPVQTSDCRLRGQACRDVCCEWDQPSPVGILGWLCAHADPTSSPPSNSKVYGGTATAEMPSCLANCDSLFGMACGLDGQISANYAVMSRKDTPSLAMMQGGSSQSPALLSADARKASTYVALVATVASVGALLL